MAGSTPFGAQPGYQNSVEPTHNGNFAWNGEPIPSYPSNASNARDRVGTNQGQASPFMGSGAPRSGMMQGGQGSQDSQGFQGSQSGQDGQRPLPGMSGNPNAPYGRRNTGINNADARNVGFQGGYTGYGPNGQPVQYGTFMRDGTQYGAGPHTIDPNKAIITGVRYQDGGISAVRFQDDSVADIAQAIGMAEAGLIEDVNTGRNREGQKTLRSYPDGDPTNNLSNLPRF
ncbi:MAG TPA: DUF3892 domain-containing protein [Paenibacillus sp.]|uniref:DUF3892 domain-containing protein n=1 Tax=Paenibacillus sp. TaxID=58172 RepID=UPI002C56A5A8|nr:DUF3892 domain-containing protein [Paenibacillus sp.]HUC93707.1 DUF3892 domain-containing protein [Paenibacillus sp.]